MPHVRSILFGAAFTVSVMWALGRLLFRRLGIGLPRAEEDLLAFACGGPCLSFLVFLLCAVHAAQKSVFLLVGAAALIAVWRFAPGTPRFALPTLPRFWKALFLALFAFYAVIYLSNSLAPEISPDGQGYHLGLVFRFFRQHGFQRFNDLYGNMPLGTEMLYLFAFAFGKNSAAATVHCCYLLALPLLILSYAARVGRPRAGVCAALIAGISPVVGIDGISAYNDVALAVTAFSLFYLLEIWRGQDPQNDALLIPIGLLAGFCYAIKMTGFIAPFYAAAVILLRKRPRALLPVAAMAAIVVLPWLIRDWLWFGNPVSPFLNRLFPNPWIHVDMEEGYRAWYRHDLLTSFSQWFPAITLTGKLGGRLGPVFVVSPLALFALRSPAGRRVLLAALFFLIPYPQNVGARFLIPTVPFIALGIAFAFEFSPALLAILALVAAITAWPRFNEKYSASGNWAIVRVPWKAALGIEHPDSFLDYRSVPWLIARMLDSYVPPGKRVWSTTSAGEAYAATDVRVWFQSAEGELVDDFLNVAAHDNLAPAWNFRFRFAPRRLQHLRLVQTAAGGDDWSVGEVGVFDGAALIARTPSWRFDAKPYPWDIALAFDGNPVTRWRSWQASRPGMYVDIDFGAPLEIDRVELHCSHDQSEIEVHPEVCDGPCIRVPATLDKLEDKMDDASRGDLRRPATRMVKQRGFDYLLIADSDDRAAGIRRDPAGWGLEFLADRAGNRLYKIQ